MPMGRTAVTTTEPFSSSPNDTTEYVYDNLDRKIEEIAPSSSTGRGPSDDDLCFRRQREHGL